MKETVLVYADPFTQKHPEGKAVVLRDLMAPTIIKAEGEFWLERYCRVVFIGHNTEPCDRWIYASADDLPECQWCGMPVAVVKPKRGTDYAHPECLEKTACGAA
jgi:hypothetical protein